MDIDSHSHETGCSPWSLCTGKELTAAILSGDAGAAAHTEAVFGKIPALVRAVHARLGFPLAPSDLEDAIQETALTAWRRLSDFRGAAAIESWLFGMGRLVILGRLKSARRRRAHGVQECLEDHDLAASAPAGPGLGTRELHVATAEAVKDQGETLEFIVRERHVDDRSFEKIATDLGMSEAGVKSRYYRSLPRLRGALNAICDP